MIKTYNLPYDIVVTVDEESRDGHIASKLKREIGKVRADALESLLLAHACAGVALDDPRYIAGFESALEGIANNL